MAKKNDNNLGAMTVPLSSLWAAWERNPRGAGELPSKTDPEAFALLKANIRAIGIVSPLTVVADKDPDGEGTYRVIAGYRRLEALIDLRDAEPEGSDRFGSVPVLVRPSAYEYTHVESVPGIDGAEPGEQVTTRMVSDATAEAIVSASENAVRRDVSAWDKIALVGKLARDGLSVSELADVLSDNGNPLSASTVRNYTKIASFPAKIAKRLRDLGGAGYKLALKLIHSDYYAPGATAIAPRWDAAKQGAAIDAWIEEKKGDDDKKKERGKKPKFVLSAADLKDRLDEINALASEDVKAVLGWLVGEYTTKELVMATDADFAAALTGESQSEEEETE